MQNELPKRKDNRLKGYDYSQGGYYFITVCVKDGQNLLGEIDVGARIARPSKIGEVVISTVINQFKGYVTKQIGFSVWQKLFHDRIIRNENEYRLIWRYIDENPLKWLDDKYYTGGRAMRAPAISNKESDE